MPRRQAIDVLERVERTSCLVSEAVRSTRALRDLDPENRSLFWEIVHGVTRHRSTLDHVLSTLTGARRRRLHPRVLQALRIGVYQMVFLDRVPATAAVNESVEVVKRSFPRPIAGFVNGCLRSVARAIDLKVGGPLSPEDVRRAVPVRGLRNCLFTKPIFPDPGADLPGSLALRYGHPPWLVASWLERYGEETAERVLQAGNEPPSLWLRASPGRLPGLVRELSRRGLRFEAEEEPVPAVRLPDRAGPVRDLPGFDKGWFTVQDRTAMRAAALLAPGPEERILDLCAAPGGKTAHLAQIAGPGAEVVAVDRAPGRLERLAETLERLGLENVSVVVGDAADPGLDLGGDFDRVLVDVPCSNTGVLSKRVEVRHRLTSEAVASLAATQARILEAAAYRLRPGGALVYSTCALTETENRGVVEAALAAIPSLELEEEMEILPRAGYSDGGYVARLEAGSVQNRTDPR